MRRGISAIEVVVVISILGLLASLILPAVQQSRETARRLQCAANLKGLATGIQAHQAAVGAFPDARLHDQLTPYMELGPAAVGNQARACPSDSESLGIQESNRHSYLPNYGVRPGDGFLPHDDDPQIGPEKFRDGLAHTVALAERLAWPSIAGQVVYWDDYPQWWNRRLRDTASRQVKLDAFADECEHRALKPLTVWVSIHYYNHVLPPNRNSCVNSSVNYEKAVTASSLHAGGVNVAMVDGSVRFVADGVDRAIWRAVATRAGRELVDGFE